MFIPTFYFLVKIPQLCLTLCHPVDCSPWVSSVLGTLQARILEWVAMPSSRGPSWPKIKPRYPALQADSLASEPPGKPSFFLKIMIVSFPSFCFFLMTWGTKIDVPEAIFLHRLIHTHTGQDKRGKMGSWVAPWILMLLFQAWGSHLPISLSWNSQKRKNESPRGLLYLKQFKKCLGTFLSVLTTIRLPLYFHSWESIMHFIVT